MVDDRRRQRSASAPPRWNSMVASASVMAHRPEGMKRQTRSENWQEDAWSFYDSVGELRFGIGWLANGMSRVNLVAARQPEASGDEPSVIVVPDPEDLEALPISMAEKAAVDLVSAIAGGTEGQGQLLALSAIQLSVPGIGWVLMEARPVEEEDGEELGDELSYEPLVPAVDPTMDVVELPAPDETWTWQVLALDEIRVSGDVYEKRVGPSDWERLADDFVLVKIWRPHPRRSWEPDSPCRAVLSVLRQIQMLDEHVQATAQSRLAGAGLLILPSEAEFAPLPHAAPAAAPAGPPTLTAASPDEISTEDDFVDVLVDTMTIPIGDRASAAAVVPLTVRIPGEFCDKPQHITFWSEFSDNLLPLREAAVKRLALGLDMPPEVLTGMAGVNHWTAWQVEETAITLHIEPMAETIVHALTIGYLRPALEAAGWSGEASKLMVWYDPTDLTTRPDRSDDALAAYDRYELSGDALRRETGLSDEDAPSDEERDRRLLTQIMLTNQQLAAQIMGDLGLSGGGAGGGLPPSPPALPPGEPAAPPADATGPPPRDQTPPPEPDDGLPVQATAEVILTACDGLVHRALERAGTKLRSYAGRKVNGGAAAIDCPDPAQLHTTLVATDYATLDRLLEGAWPRLPFVASRLGMEPVPLRMTLDTYVRALLATGHAHDPDRLADALGLVVAPA